MKASEYISVLYYDFVGRFKPLFNLYLNCEEQEKNIWNARTVFITYLFKGWNSNGFKENIVYIKREIPYNL